LRAQQTNVSALQMQVATIANYQTQIDQLNSQLKDAKAQNASLNNLSNQINNIKDVQNQTDRLNQELRQSIQNNQQLKDECEKRSAQLEITLSTIRGEKAASDRIVE
jgi:uncharacterized coiled-coil DUF342 family protein